jgi:hypothetical protein
MRAEERHLTLATRSGRRGSLVVIDLSHARDERRLREYQRRSRQVLESNKRALARLFQSGLIYTRSGARLARDLLQAHQSLLRVSDLLAQLGQMEAGERGATDAVYHEVQALLSRTAALSARSDVILARR